MSTASAEYSLVAVNAVMIYTEVMLVNGFGMGPRTSTPTAALTIYRQKYSFCNFSN